MTDKFKCNECDFEEVDEEGDVCEHCSDMFEDEDMEEDDE